MTGIDLQNTLSALGCPESVFEEHLFLYLLNTALRRIYNDVPIISSSSVYAHGILPKSKKDIHHAAGKDITIPVVGKAYSMRISGSDAVIYVGTGLSTNTFRISKGPRIIKGFTVDNTAVISLCGEYDYTAYDFCIYDELPSTLEEDIPEGTDLTYFSVDLLYPDFFSFTGHPTDTDGNRIEGAVAAEGKIGVAADFKGEIHFNYRKRPIRHLPGELDSDIEVSDDCLELLPLAMLGYLYLDIDEDKAQIYFDSYESLLKSMPKKESFVTAVKDPLSDTQNPLPEQSMTGEYIITNGWA